jgi:hypothetical protein
MTPEQKLALEALVGRELDENEVFHINAALATGGWARIAEVLSVGRTKVGSHFASERGLMERFPGGPLAADALLTKLEQASAGATPFASLLRRALKFLAQPEGLDIGAPATQAMLAQLTAAKVLTDVELAGLRFMCLRPDPITDAQVKSALGA